MRDDVEVTRHEILGLGHDSLARRRHSVRPTSGCGSLGVWRSDGPGRGTSVAVSVSLPLDLTAVCRMVICATITLLEERPQEDDSWQKFML